MDVESLQPAEQSIYVAIFVPPSLWEPLSDGHTPDAHMFSVHAGSPTLNSYWCRIIALIEGAFADAIVLGGVDTRQKLNAHDIESYQGRERAWRCCARPPHRDRRGSNPLHSHHAEEPRSILLFGGGFLRRKRDSYYILMQPPLPVVLEKHENGENRGQNEKKRSDESFRIVTRCVLIKNDDGTTTTTTTILYFPRTPSSPIKSAREHF